MVARRESRYMGRLPYCCASGWQIRHPHPKARNMYPVPVLRSSTESSVASEMGVKME